MSEQHDQTRDHNPDTAIRRQVYLESLKRSEADKFMKTLNALDKDISYHLLGDELIEMSQTDFDKVMRHMRRGVLSRLSDFVRGAMDTLATLAWHRYGFERRAISGQLKRPLPSLLPLPEPAKQALVWRMVSQAPLSIKGREGRLIAELFKDFSEGETARIIGAIRHARYQGKTNAQIKQMIRGTRKNRYQDGLLNVTARQAETITRTTVQHIAMQAKIAMMRDMGVDKIQIIATLDGRTSSICRALDHQIFARSDGMIPPFHFNCRSTIRAVVDPKYAGKDSAMRASMHGPVANMSYYEWLKTQPRDFIEDVIGKQRAKLLLEGGLSADEFARLQLDKNFRPLTLAQIKEREPMMFVRAGLGVGDLEDRFLNVKDVQPTQQDLLRLLIDPATNKENIGEATAIAKMEKLLNSQARRLTPDEIAIAQQQGLKTGDGVFISGEWQGVKFDLMFTTDDLSENSAAMQNKYFLDKKGGLSKQNKNSILDHLSKDVDIIPMELSRLSQESRLALLEYINSLPKADQDRIIYLEER